MSSYIATIFSLMILTLSLRAGAQSQDENKFKFSADFFGSHVSLMPYKGYQDDLSGTLYAQYGTVPLRLFVRYVDTNYYYQLPTATSYTSDHRTAAGIGLDIPLNEYVRLRLISEYITNKLSGTSYQQESYGLIYNQYLDFSFIELNNYLESFYIPRASNKIDTFVRLQALKSFYLTRSNESSNAIFPLVQFKGKYNDDAVFGVSGQNASVGAGYKYFRKFDNSTLAFLIEGHSVFYQSRDFYGDWFQTLAVLQWLVN